ncbi:MAG: acyltransferase [Alphaproteobacteria bacterium]|jgi:maltose O-acetyltransferase|nr:acyltransferase [Alphaproteobacteria bacterium]
MSVHKDIARIFLHIYRRLIRFARETGIRMVVAEAGRNLKVFGRVRIDMPQKIHIGDDCTLNEGVLIVGRDDVRIGNNVTLSAYVVIVSAGIESGQPRRHSQAPVTIEDNVWVAANATILPGVNLGEGAMIAAGAVVTENIPANVMAAGVPARVIKPLQPFSERGKPQTLAA